MEPDIDFNDVFGGPPKRSTSQESPYSFTEPTRRGSRTDEDDDVALPRNPWSGMMEKPVFGEETGNRRKYKSDDFYDDIFMGDEAVSSPRRSSHEPFGSSPGSRVMSPARALSPMGDMFGTSLPAQVQFSLPAKSTRGMDSPTFSSGNRTSQKYKEPISSLKSFQYTPSSPLYRPSPLSHEVSLISEVPSFAIKPEKLKSPEVQNKVKNDENNPEDAKNGNQFHFYIYKWASKGVPMLIPLRGAKSAKMKDAIRTEVLSANNKVHHAEEIKQATKTTKMDYETVSNADTKAEVIKVAVQDTQEEKKPELKSLRSFLGTSEDEGEGKINEKFEKKDYATKKVQKRDEKKYNSRREEVNRVKEPQEIGSKKDSKGTIGKSKGKGKVKEFVNIFNQEADLKPKIDTETNSRNSERGSASFGKGDKETRNKTPEVNGNHMHGLNKIQTPSIAAVPLDKNLEESEKHQSHLKKSVADVKTNFRGQKSHKASIESHPANKQVIAEDQDDFYENFTVQELSNDQDKPVQGEDSYEDIQTSDARIRNWSRGKEGNIRSLLSTLQDVLWPGSGWKPVPLVDIIEGSAVKRSYQRALLCLHPDKLQQKGAADYQKYIAEKVFDILQEAWDQFNSLGLM